ncbi:hypothetical protein D3C85_1670950 [compost metagenome]
MTPWEPINSEWIRTVERGGKVNLAVGMSLTLMSSICWGIANPFSWMALSTPMAMESEATNRARGQSPASISFANR